MVKIKIQKHVTHKEDGPRLLMMMYVEMVRSHGDYRFNPNHSILPYLCSGVCEVLTKYPAQQHCQLKKTRSIKTFFLRKYRLTIKKIIYAIYNTQKYSKICICSRFYLGKNNLQFFRAEASLEFILIYACMRDFNVSPESNTTLDTQCVYINKVSLF